jgi:hypothetical protein
LRDEVQVEEVEEDQSLSQNIKGLLIQNEVEDQK